MKYKIILLIILIVCAIIPVHNTNAEDNNAISNVISAAYKDYYSGNVTNAINTLDSFLSNIPKNKLLFSNDLWIANSSLLEMCEVVGDVNCCLNGTNRLISIYKSLKPSDQADKLYLNEEINYHVIYNQLLVDNIDNLGHVSKSKLLDMYSKPYSPVWYIKNQLLSARIHLRFRDYTAARLSADRAFAMILSFKPSIDYKSFIAKSLLEVINLFMAIGDTTRAAKIFLTSNYFIGNTLSENEPHAIIYALLLAQHNEYLGQFQFASSNFQWILERLKYISLPLNIKESIYATVSPRLSMMCVLLDNGVCANDAIKANPLYNNIDNIIFYKKLKNRQELLFIASYILTQSVANNLDIEDNVIQLLIQPLEYNEPDNGINLSNEAIKYWALGIAQRKKNMHTSTLDFANSAIIHLKIYEDEYIKTDSSFLLLDAYQKLMLGSGAVAIADDDYKEENKYELLLKIIESFNRGLRNGDSDAYIRQAAADNEDLKQYIRSLYLLSIKKAEIEVKRLSELIENINTMKDTALNADNNIINFPTFLYLEQFEDQKQKFNYDSSISNQYNANIFQLTKIKELQHILNEDELFISNMIFLGHIIHIGVTKDSVSSYNISADIEMINKDIQRLNMSLRSGHPPSIESDSQYPVESAIRLYNNLLKPFETLLIGKKHIIWSPDPNIYDLPLNCLLKSTPPKLNIGYDLSKAEWTIKYYALSYVNSAKGFIASRRLQNILSTKYDFLGIGDPLLSGITNEGTSRGLFISRRSSDIEAIGVNALSSLPETSEELKNIALLFNGQKDLLLKENATEKIFRQQSLSNYQFIEFATHGLIKNDIKGLKEPALVLTPQTEKDESNDGLLTASEIARLNLNAKLVVLSSCNSASYQLENFGLEVQGLTTAFALAGVPTTIASLWPVESKTTQIINTSLYKELKFNKYDGVAIAHHNAINVFLKSDIAPEYYHPRFWAPFVVYGDGGNKKENKKTLKKHNLEFDKMFISRDNMYGPRKSSPDLRTKQNEGFYVPAYGNYENGKASDSLLNISIDGSTIWKFNEKLFGNSYLLNDPKNNRNYLIGNELLAINNFKPIVIKINEFGNKEWEYSYFIDNNYTYCAAIGAIILEDGKILIAYDASDNNLESKGLIFMIIIDHNGIELNRFVIECDLKFTIHKSIAINKTMDRIVFTGSIIDIYDINPRYGRYLIKRNLEIRPKTEIIIINTKKMDVVYRKMLNSALIYGIYSDDSSGFYMVGGHSESKPFITTNLIVYNISKDGVTNTLYEEKGPYNIYANGLVEIDNNLAIYGDMEIVWDIEAPEEAIPFEKRINNAFSDPKTRKQNRKLLTNGIVILINKDGKLLDKNTFANGASIEFLNGVYINNSLWIFGANSNELMMVKYKHIRE